MKFKKVATIVAGLTVVIPVSLASQANAGSNLCPSKQVCIYEDNNFVGLMGYRRAGLGIMNVSGKNNDIMSSYENKSGTNARWCHDADGKGRCVTMLAYRSDNDINTWDDDELTSWATNGSC